MKKLKKIYWMLLIVLCAACNDPYDGDTFVVFDTQPAEIENFLLEDNKSGLIILHGKQGTGKTTYIRHLINLGNRI